MQRIRMKRIRSVENAADQKRRGLDNDVFFYSYYSFGMQGLACLGQKITRTFSTSPESELPGTKLFCTFSQKGVNNGFKAPLLYTVNFPVDYDMRSDGPKRAFVLRPPRRRRRRCSEGWKGVEGEGVRQEKRQMSSSLQIRTMWQQSWWVIRCVT